MGAFRRRWPGLSYGRGEDWHYVGETGEPAFQNSWGNLTADYFNFAFRIRESGVVDIQGNVTGGANGTAICTLPSGYKPSTVAAYVTGVVGSNGGSPALYRPAFLTVTAGGEVLAYWSSADTVTEVFVAGQFFLTPAQAP